MDVFNRSFVTQFQKVALDYDIDLSRYCPTRKFYSDLRCLETYSNSIHNTYIIYVGPKFTDCFGIPVGILHCHGITCVHAIVYGSVVIKRMYLCFVYPLH